MKYKIVEKENKRFIEILNPITNESDVLDIIGVCISSSVDSLVLRKEIFTEDFINLKSGLAGIVLQKFVNYHIKAAAIIEDKTLIQGRFKELVKELNRSDYFRVFNNINDAEVWLIK